MPDTNTLLPEVRSIVLEAGLVIEKIRRGAVEETLKADESPVTLADTEADALLKRKLTGLFPAGWLSEETADSEHRLSERCLWVVDPLDGTKEFIQNIPEYSVAVALVEDGLPTLGVVHNPVTGETFWATKGGGAYRDGVAISVADSKRLLASRSEMKRGEFDPFTDGWDVVHIGSIEYKLGLVAAGEGSTISRGPKWEWDVCAGTLIVQEAGGRATDAFGAPLVFNQPFPKVKGILAAAPTTYKRLLDRVAKLGPSDRMDELLAQ